MTTSGMTQPSFCRRLSRKEISPCGRNDCKVIEGGIIAVARIDPGEWVSWSCSWVIGDVVRRVAGAAYFYLGLDGKICRPGKQSACRRA